MVRTAGAGVTRPGHVNHGWPAVLDRADDAAEPKPVLHQDRWVGRLKVMAHRRDGGHHPIFEEYPHPCFEVIDQDGATVGEQVQLAGRINRGHFSVAERLWEGVIEPHFDGQNLNRRGRRCRRALLSWSPGVAASWNR